MEPALSFSDVSLSFEGRFRALDALDWDVRGGERWVVLGANGSGKSSLLRLAGGWIFPSAGVVRVLGREIGRIDVRELQRRIGYASGALVAKLRPGALAEDVVMTARHAALESYWHTYDDADRARARDLLARMGCAHLVGRTLGSASDGERQRVQLARTLMVDPDLLLLDEPTAGLDLGGREALVARLADLARDDAAPPTVLVTHHAEEIPPGFTHCLLLRSGRVLVAGPLEDTLTADALSACFDMKVALERRGERWLAFAS